MGHGYNTTWTHGAAIICIKLTVLLASVLKADFRGRKSDFMHKISSFVESGAFHHVTADPQNMTTDVPLNTHCSWETDKISPPNLSVQLIFPLQIIPKLNYVLLTCYLFPLVVIHSICCNTFQSQI